MVIQSGLKINDKELQKFADSIVEKYVNKYISAGNKAQEEIRTKYTIDWFRHESHTMADALRFEHKLVQKGDLATIYFTSYVDMNRFQITTLFNDPSIHEWADRYHVGINPAQYLLDLQWNQGIHGLPREWSRPNYRFGQTWNDGVDRWRNPIYDQGMPMNNYVRYGFHKEWEKTVNKYLKR